MKFILSLALVFVAASCTTEVSYEDSAADSTTQTVTAGCAECTWHMEGTGGCALAVEVAGKPYMVTGADFDMHEAGLCEGTKQVEIVGAIDGDKFAAASVKLAE